RAAGPRGRARREHAGIADAEPADVAAGRADRVRWGSEDPVALEEDAESCGQQVQAREAVLYRAARRCAIDDFENIFACRVRIECHSVGVVRWSPQPTRPHMGMEGSDYPVRQADDVAAFR